MNGINSYTNDMNSTLLDLILKNSREKSGIKQQGNNSMKTHSSNDSVSLSADYTASILTISASISVSVSSGKVDIYNGDSGNSEMMRLPQYVAGDNSYASGRCLTRANPPAMSDKEFEKAIVDLAQKNAAVGNYEAHFRDEEYMQLFDSYTSVVSPDRTGLFASAAQKSLIPSNLNGDMAKVYDENGTLCASYNPKQGWMTRTTPQEAKRSQQFRDIYCKAFNEALDKDVYRPIATYL